MPFPNIGPGELILILIIALVVLGPGKLPDVAASLGKSVREFRKAATDITDAARVDTPAAAPAEASPQVQAAAAPAPAAPAPAAPQQSDAAPAAPGDAASDPKQS